jgi:hypothetical protein
VVGGAAAPLPAGDAEVEAAVQRRLADGASTRDAADAAAADLGVSRRRAYDIALAQRAAPGRHRG